ncbi:DUF6258 family protein [Undibacterium sp. Ji83W]|uniref:DUF6258 family protein n=1 Tax=Undibacterium sp. Ji83W TaxID=3413043 RepID=UPI003BEFD7C5
MTPIEFYRTIYIGDRWCKEVMIDGVAREIKLKIDLISRVRGAQWDYYADEDLPDGFIVLENVDRFEFSPQGLIPNDWIDFISVSEVAEEGCYKFDFSLGACTSETAAPTEVTLTVFAKKLCLADATGHKIRI